MNTKKIRNTFLCVALLSIAIAAPIEAQTTDTNATTPTLQAGLSQIISAVSAAKISSATNYSFDPYLTYAPKAPENFGGGILAIYNVNQYVGAGLGVDYLGSFSLVSGNATLKLPTHPLNWTGWAWATNFTVTPFALAGAGKPLSGTSASISVIADIGVATEFGHVWGGKWTAGACWGKWSNAGDYSVQRYHAFFGWTRGF